MPAIAISGYPEQLINVRYGEVEDLPRTTALGAVPS